MTEDIRNRQEHVQFLENYIKELTDKIDEITNGRDMEKMIRSLEYRIEVLGKSEGKFNGRIHEFQSDLESLRSEFKRLEPILTTLDEERAYYRHLQSGL